jgi:phosphoglycerol transferase MdoB-like AlkP superfamily enzyme
MWFLAYFLLHLIVYTLIRVEFLVWNWQGLKSLSFLEILWAFVNGLRFDASVLAATVGLCFLGLIWISKYKIATRVLLGFFVLLNATLYILNFGDVELFNFTAKRFSVATLYLVGEGDIIDQTLPYTKLIIFSVLVLSLYLFGVFRLVKKYNKNFDMKQKLIGSFLILAVGVVVSRGGLQLKPMTYVDAKIFNSSYANNLVLNSSFTLLKSIGKDSLQREHHFEKEQLLSYLNPQDIPPVETPEVNKLNIVIVVFESLSKEYLVLRNPEAAPYFNHLRTQSVDFTNSYANGRRSIEGIAAILSGIPALMEEPFISSEFSANQIIGLGTILQAHNYNTSFFHGTENGSMHFDSFTKSVGIENYYGLKEYPDKNDDDGTWGVYDEPFLQWACRKYSEFKPPFFSTIFTLSSHQPYNLPEKYKDRFKDDRNPMLKSIQYADYSLEQFMKCAEKQPWYANTLFIFTGDHTGPALDESSSFESRYKIPLVMFSPKADLLKNVNPNQYVQQIDVLPTLLDILKIEYKNKNYLSRSVLRSGPKVIALYADRQYQLVGDVKDKDHQLQAIQQYFSEGMYDNRLYYPVK